MGILDHLGNESYFRGYFEQVFVTEYDVVDTYMINIVELDFKIYKVVYEVPVRATDV